MKNFFKIFLLLCILFLGIMRVNATNDEILSGIIERDGLYYYYENNQMQTGFQTIDGKTYFFGRLNGAMRTGIINVDGTNYYFDDTGVMQTGVQMVDDSVYYFNEKGQMQTGFQTINGKTYFFGRLNGAMRTGIINVDGISYCFDNTGVMQTGFQTVDGSVYYFNEKGQMQTGFQTINGKTYFFGRLNGAMRTGFFSIDGSYYYFAEDGVMQTGFQTINGKTYFFGRLNGAMRTGFFSIDGSYYYFAEDGVMQTGFQTIDGKTYFFGRLNGAMRTGMVGIDGSYYYFAEDGVMQTGLVTLNGNKYFFANNGKRQQGFQTINGKVYFFSRINDNAMKYGWQNVDGYFYYFDEPTGIMRTSDLKIGDITYEFCSNGIAKLVGWNTINGSRYYFNAGYMMIGVNEKLVIDVSAHQGVIDWNAVYNSGKIYGVILRIGYWDTEDSRLAYNLSELKRLGIPYGVYLFSYASTTNGANIEANFTNNIIRKYNLNPTLGIYYDIEDWYISENNTSNILSANDYDNIISTYLNSVKSYVGNKYKVKVYANLNFANNRFNTYARNEIDWIAQYNSSCSYTGKYSMWQFTSSGTINGINGYVDMNYLYSN